MPARSTLLLRAANVLTALALIVGGAANLTGVAVMPRSFAELGSPVWFGIN